MGDIALRGQGRAMFARGSTPAWQRKEGKSQSGGLNRKGIVVSLFFLLGCTLAIELDIFVAQTFLRFVSFVQWSHLRRSIPLASWRQGSQGLRRALRLIYSTALGRFHPLKRPRS